MKILIGLCLMLTSCFADYPQAKEITVRSNGADLFCRIAGNGDPIIVIHGGPGLSQDYLYPQLITLAKSNQVIFYDQRGCGQSKGEISTETINLTTYLSDIETIRKHLGLKKVVILGHSWGGFLAFQYALAYPESIQKLIILNGMPCSNKEFAQFEEEWIKRMAPYQQELKALTESEEFLLGNIAITEKYYRIIFKTYCYDPEKANTLNLILSPEASINGGKVSQIFTETVISKPFNYHPLLKNLETPTLIIHGDYDPIPFSIAQKLHLTLQNSKLIILKECGHFPYVETPQPFFKHLNHFLSEI